MLDHKALVKELDALVAECKAMRARSKYDDCSDLPDAETVAMLTSLASSVRRLAPPGSQYIESVEGIFKKAGYDNCTVLPALLGIVIALRNDIQGGRTQAVVELIHADLFTDLLEMADHLLTEGYKNPAAVIAGSVLEVHLRQLATKHDVQVNEPRGQPKKTDVLNAELGRVTVYSKGDQKNITAWLHLRNSAAHGTVRGVRERAGSSTHSVRSRLHCAGACVRSICTSL